jgi:crotonobetainyl-CoA:carnitine CoA-transferase CaiB-like acyl-CoA transferase
VLDVLADWTAVRDKTDIAQRLQARGVPAAPMNRAADVLADPQWVHRRTFTAMTHPLFDAPMPTETRPAPSRDGIDASLRPAPLAGEHTREICQKLLGLATDEIDALIADRVLFTS